MKNGHTNTDDGRGLGWGNRTRVTKSLKEREIDVVGENERFKVGEEGRL